MSEIKKSKSIASIRVITGAGIGITVIGLFYLGNIAASYLFLAIAILGSYELANMVHPDASNVKIYAHVIVGALPFILLSYLDLDQSSFTYLLYSVCTFFMVMILDLYRKSHFKYDKYSYFFVFFYWGMSFGLASYYLKNDVNYMYNQMIGIMAILWTSDSMAYFIGKKLGKHKLFPSVSPNKTIEGSLGAGFFSILISLLIAYLTDDSYIRWMIIALVIWVFGTYGDLVESKIKRTSGVKDSGNILPGHGGFMDRFDSLAFIIPFLLLLTYLFEK